MNKFETASSVTASLSTIACLFIIFAYLLVPNIRALFHSKVMLLIAISNLLFSTTAFNPHIQGIFANNGKNSICYAVAFLRESSFILSLLSTALFAQLLYRLVKLEDTKLMKFMLAFVVGSITLAGIISVYPLLTNAYGKYDSYCWIDESLSKSSFLLTLALVFYFPLVVVFIHNLVCLIIVALDLRRRESQPSCRVFQLLLFPTALIVCFFGEMIDKMYQLSSGNQSPDWLRFLGIIGMQTSGFVNGILYGLNHQGRAILGHSCTVGRESVHESILMSRTVSRTNTNSSMSRYKLM